jgi:large subunit ribosomal protein L3
MKFISGKKLSMTQIWVDNKVMAVTPVLAGPCTITQVKTKDSDGYEALQLAFGNRQAKNIKKPQLGHYKKSGTQPAHVKEFRTSAASDFKIGDTVSVETFAVGDIINVTGTSKGRGFQGVIKRHHFHGFRKTHGNKDQERMPGSIGAKGPAHVFKGMKMGGRMGNERVTTTNLEVMSIDTDKNIIFVKGAVPGAINGFIFIQGKGDLKVNLKKVVTEVKEDTKIEDKKEDTKNEDKKEEPKSEKTENKVEEVKELKKEENKVEEVKVEESKESKPEENKIKEELKK